MTKEQEEAIEIVQSLINQTKENVKNNIENLSENRITNRISGYRALETLLDLYYKEKEKNKELTETYKSEKKMKNEYVKLYQDLLLKENVIPIQRVKDIIDRIDYDIKKTKEIISNNRRDYQRNDYQIVRLKAMNTKSLDIKKRLQKLLESEE